MKRKESIFQAGTAEHSASKELEESHCTREAESKSELGARNRGRWRLHDTALTWHKKDKINVGFPCLDFPSSLISKDLENTFCFAENVVSVSVDLY